MIKTAIAERLKSIHAAPFHILDQSISTTDYIALDLSKTNKSLDALDMSNPYLMDTFIKQYLEKEKGKVAYGGYLETRALYDSSAIFDSNPKHPRNIHLGVDFWASSETIVHVPLDGKVHSFKNNKESGNYGPTIILEHELESEVFYSLYGHLSTSSLNGLYPGKAFKTGDILARLGTPEENVNYAPHLHFQLILDIGEYLGDYPGVCTKNDIEFFSKNCPDPNLLLKF